MGKKNSTYKRTFRAMRNRGMSKKKAKKFARRAQNKKNAKRKKR